MDEKNNKKTIAIVVYPGFSLLELVGAQHVWVSATMMSAYQAVVVGPTTDFIASNTSLKMKPQKTFAEAPQPYALILIGGGEASTQAMQNSELVDYVRRSAATAEIIAAFGTGTLILGAAGLLQGKQVTTHWAYSNQLEAFGCHYLRQPWVEDGKITTGSGSSSAVDVSLALVDRLRGRAAAQQVQITAEWDPKPPFGGIDWGKMNSGFATAAAPAIASLERTLALVIYPGLTVFDLVGPLELLTALSKIRPEFKPVVVAEQAEPLTSDSGLTFMPNATFAEVPSPYVLVVPGGGQATLHAMSNPVLRQYIRFADRSTQYTVSVCTGALLLASVGMLSGRDATTHWGYVNYLEAFGACYQRKRWVAAGKIINSAGVSAGIDMALYLISRLTDDQTARQVQLAIQYDPRPPFGEIDYDHFPPMMKAIRAFMGLLSPYYTRRPKQLLQQGL
jgi:transcriptional regulator GlxA family with amidase domain